ncbi:uncharacterized protein [Panulirus ornatus]|uniref:uncharacterized protein n=1 Tax=Panulirus ornatus TaxID=150431 RepID=UPI003A8389C3
MLKLVSLCVVLGLALGQDDGNTRLFGHGFNGGLGLHVGGHTGPHNPSSGCRYWCKQPHGEYGCCDNGPPPPIPDGGKPGSCPIVRLECPPTRLFDGPQTCFNDYTCAGSDKCCYDTCLGERVCKPVEFPFGGR